MELQLFGGALIAEIAGTIAGFGSSSIFLPIASQFLTFHNALVLVAIYHIFGNISRFSLFWKHRNKRIFWLFGIPSIIATVIGASLASRANPELLKLILGVVLISFALYSLLKPSFRFQPTPLVGRLGGAASGFTAGLIGTGGVLRGAFLTSFGLTKEAYIATIASIALLVDITRIPVYFANGMMDHSLLWMIPVLFVIAFIGSWIGKQVVKRIDEKVLRKVILVAIIVVSGMLSLQGLSGLTTTKVSGKVQVSASANGLLSGTDTIQFFRQSGVECSSYSTYIASQILGVQVGSQQEIRDSLGPKFSFGILPISFEKYLKKYFTVQAIQVYEDINDTLNQVRYEIDNGNVVILLVEHQGYQHYFTILGYNTPDDERYIYDSLAPRLDDTYTVDTNGSQPGNYTIDSNTLFDKRSQGGKYGFREWWGVALSTQE